MKTQINKSGIEREFTRQLVSKFGDQLGEAIHAQVAKSEVKLKAAQWLDKSHFPDDAISRAYCAIFHAESAVHKLKF